MPDTLSRTIRLGRWSAELQRYRQIRMTARNNVVRNCTWLKTTDVGKSQYGTVSTAHRRVQHKSGSPVLRENVVRRLNRGPASILFVAIVIGSSFIFTNIAEFTYAALYEQALTAPYRCLDRVDEEPSTVVSPLPKPVDCKTKQLISRDDAISGGDFLLRCIYIGLVIVSCWFWYAFNLQSPLQLRKRLADTVAEKLRDRAKQVRMRISQR